MAVKWADAVIAADQDPPAAVIEVALASRSDLEELRRLLGAVPGTDWETLAGRRAFLAELRRAFEADPGSGSAIARAIWLAAGRGDLPEADFGWEPLVLHDHYQLATMGYVEAAEAATRLGDFLRAHAA
jgi:hypothetical protein